MRIITSSFITTFLTLLFLILSINKMIGADFTIDGSGIEETSSIFTYDEGKIFLIWKANFQNENNLGVLSVGNCGGTIHIINGKQDQNIMCEVRNKYGKFNFINNKASGDNAGTGNANRQQFTIVGGDGIWKDFIGVKCFGAYFGMPENHFTWKGKCNVPDSLIKNTKEKIANFKEDN